MTGTLHYSSNNSGGSWWLKDEDWQHLEEAGWIVHWFHDVDDPSHVHVDDPGERRLSDHSHGYSNTLIPAPQTGQRWLGALAKSAAIQTDDPDQAVLDWERITNQNAAEEGCNCCGEPHYFTFTDANGKTASTSVVITGSELKWS
jgi:hypothetical protein